jgi:uncharacterized membrane protein YdbT with pleckstrin-like domain
MQQEEYHFKGQQAGERVALYLRQHPFVLVEHGVKVISLLFVALLFFRLLGYNAFVAVLLPLCFIVALIIAFRSWYGWWNTMLLLTNERVLFVEQRGFTSRKMSEALLSNIQFVTNEVKGIAHTVFNFGDVRIQTAGSAETLWLRELSDPYDIQQRITELQRKEHRSGQQEHSLATDRAKIEVED